MAATKLQANWSAVSFNSTTLSQITGVSINLGGQISTFKADASIFPTVGVNLDNKPGITVTGADAGTMMGLKGAVGVFTATHNDAKGATGGAITYTTNSGTICENVETSGQHAQFGQATMTLVPISADGTTPPISFTRS